MNTTPITLLERLRQPSEQTAWTRFTTLYTPLLYHWARRTGLRTEDAADLVQDVFAVLVEKLPEFTYDRHRSFRAWLRTVTLNKWRDRMKCRATRPLAEANTNLDDLAAPDGSDAFEETEYRQHLVSRALQVMQADFQPATWKACWEQVVVGRPAGEVAVELGISLGAAYAARFRVLGRLRQELEGLLE